MLEAKEVATALKNSMPLDNPSNQLVGRVPEIDIILLDYINKHTALVEQYLFSHQESKIST